MSSGFTVVAARAASVALGATIRFRTYTYFPAGSISRIIIDHLPGSWTVLTMEALTGSMT